MPSAVAGLILARFDKLAARRTPNAPIRLGSWADLSRSKLLESITGREQLFWADWLDNARHQRFLVEAAMATSPATVSATT